MRICPRCRSVYAAPVAHCGLDGEKIIEQDRDPLIGEVLERYRIVARVGQGAMGIVYRAIHTVISRDYAIKVLFGELAADRTILARLRREAQAASKIRHPNVVNVEDFGSTTAGLHFLVMELVQGRTLYEAIKREAPFPPARAAAIARQLASGLAEAHRLGFIHRDLKPSNVMLSEVEEREHAKLLDFGVVAAPREEPAGAAPLTALGAIIGTPMYMAPEQSEAECTPAVDLYALGVILFEMLAGSPPFTGRPRELLKKHLSDPPPALAPAGGLEMLVAALLEKDPQHRPGNAEAVIAAIDALGFSGAAADREEASVGLEIAEDTSPNAEARRALASSPSLANAERDAFQISVVEEPTSKDIHALPPKPQKIAAPPNTPPNARAAPPNTPPNAPAAPPNAPAAPRNTPVAPPNERTRERGVSVRGVEVGRASGAGGAGSASANVASPLDTFAPSLESRAPRTSVAFIAAGAILFAAAGGFAAHFLRTRDRVELIELPDLPVPVPAPPPRASTIAATFAPDRPETSPPEPTRPRAPVVLDDPRLSVLEVHLQQALSERGLTIADLDDLPTVAPLAKRWRAARENNAADEAIAATGALGDELRRTQIGLPFLKLKLKRVADRLANTPPDLDDAALDELKKRAAQIGGEVRPGLAPATYTNLAIMIMILEDDLHRVQSAPNSR